MLQPPSGLSSGQGWPAGFATPWIENASEMQHSEQGPQERPISADFRST
jgi:hypothetical protein